MELELYSQRCLRNNIHDSFLPRNRNRGFKLLLITSWRKISNKDRYSARKSSLNCSNKKSTDTQTKLVSQKISNMNASPSTNSTSDNPSTYNKFPLMESNTNRLSN
jgi:hypothetical protein